jgi:hypothetical protein
VVGRTQQPGNDSRHQIGRGGCRTTLELKAILDELSNGVNRALTQVCSLVNDAAGNALHPGYGGL